MKAMILLATLAAAGGADAHVVLSPDHGAPGAYYAGVVRVSHGCEGAATTAVRVEIPRALLSAKPQPKPGWTLTLEREPLTPPVRAEGGRMQTQRVKAITWTGTLPDEQFDTFGISLKLPDKAGPLYLPTVQTCGATAVRWTDIPAPGRPWHSVPHPAPALTLDSAAEPMAGMSHP